MIPLFAVIILMTAYFSRYKDEELGWNTALGNSLILIFVSIDLFRAIFNNSTPGTAHNFVTYGGATVLVSLLLLDGILLLTINFTHFLPKKIAYLLSSPIFVNLTAYLLITLVYLSLPINPATIIAAIIVFAILFSIFHALHIFCRRMWHKLDKLKLKELKQDLTKEKQVIEETKKLLKEQKEKINHKK